MDKTKMALIALAMMFFGTGITEFIAVGLLPMLSQEFSIASSVAVSLVSPTKSAGAIAFIFSGFTIATAFAVPLGTYLSSFFSWRLPFWSVVAVAALTLWLNYHCIPNDAGQATTSPNWRNQ
ncbi:MFS transporter [uncultured Megasphaera sp.]|uniref:MFS transporter n=1 Tax=uncultured Megasphaera sp. TaxID=165188 RepID=UPI0025ED1233|nr:MFS transporter [uncultured Megasphaera sp.]